MRILDILFCIFVIAFLLWMLPFFALWIRLDSKGPIFFRQTRVGRNEAPFECIKFRTMHLGTQNIGTHEVGQTSVTKAGNILRKLKIDELPQTWNLLKGEMSLIGPRPSLPTQTDVTSHR
ncbi:sugar transferase, partial [Ascidiaceihabitans sp.]|nr:sugar transferase [Ascidiaceihabitans sp.]